MCGVWILGTSLKPYKRQNIWNNHLCVACVHIPSVSQFGARNFSLTSMLVYRCLEEGLGWRWRQAKHFRSSRLHSTNCAVGADRLQVCLGPRSVFRWSPHWSLLCWGLGKNLSCGCRLSEISAVDGVDSLKELCNYICINLLWMASTSKS